jgi:hypothetical protein
MERNDMDRPEDEFTDDPPPRRRNRRDDDDYDDVADRIRRRPAQLSGLDGTFANTNIVVLVLFAFCCNGIALILGIVGLCVCKDELAKRNAMIVTIIGGIITALGVMGQIAQIAMKH